jgi:basic membrane protein A
MSAFAPQAHLTAPIWNWGPFYVQTVAEVRNGTWESESVWYGMQQGMVDLAPFGPMVPEALRKRVSDKKAEILAGTAQLFVGPLIDQSGDVQVPAGRAATDEELLNMKYFVKGVIGTLE